MPTEKRVHRIDTRKLSRRPAFPVKKYTASPSAVLRRALIVTALTQHALLHQHETIHRILLYHHKVFEVVFCGVYPEVFFLDDVMDNTRACTEHFGIIRQVIEPCFQQFGMAQKSIYR